MDKKYQPELWQAQNTKTGLWYVKGKHFTGKNRAEATLLWSSEATLIRASYDHNNTLLVKAIPYRVEPMREAGLEVRWGHDRGHRPVIFARKAGSTGLWFEVTWEMFSNMQEEGILPAFERFTAVGDIFSIPA